MRRVAVCLVVAVVVALAGTTGAPTGAASSGAGLLRPKDVGYPVTGAAHAAELIRASQRAPASCADPATREYEGQRITFGAKGVGASGPSLNEYVLASSSEDAAARMFDELHADNDAAVQCATASSRPGVSLTSSPKGLGDQRYTFTNRITIGGGSVPVTEIGARDGSDVVVLVFVGWPTGTPSPTSIATKAVKRVAA